MNLKTYDEARARITKIADEKTRIAACSVLEGRWYSDVATTALKLGEYSLLHKDYYKTFGKYLVNTLLSPHSEISCSLFPKGDPKEIIDLLDFLDSMAEK